MNYEELTNDQEQQVITDLKDVLRGILLENGHYSGYEKPRNFAVYALLELAAEIACDDITNITSFFIDAAHEVDDVFTHDPSRFLKNET